VTALAERQAVAFFEPQFRMLPDLLDVVDFDCWLLTLFYAVSAPGIAIQKPAAKLAPALVISTLRGTATETVILLARLRLSVLPTVAPLNKSRTTGIATGFFHFTFRLG
jgi:hypothetical protein